jgi:hypothetical protein
MALYDQNLNQKINALPPEMQQEVVDFVEFLASKYQKKKKMSDSDGAIPHQSSTTVYDLIKDLGVIGAFEGPEDLATNKAYLDGLGEK